MKVFLFDLLMFILWGMIGFILNSFSSFTNYLMSIILFLALINLFKLCISENFWLRFEVGFFSRTMTYTILDVFITPIIDKFIHTRTEVNVLFDITYCFLDNLPFAYKNELLEFYIESISRVTDSAYDERIVRFYRSYLLNEKKIYLYEKSRISKDIAYLVIIEYINSREVDPKKYYFESFKNLFLICVDAHPLLKQYEDSFFIPENETTILESLLSSLKYHI